MAKASKPKNTVEVAKAISPETEKPSCMSCAFRVNRTGYFMCDIKLPPWVRRAERATSFIVSPTDVCDLHKAKA